MTWSRFDDNFPDDPRTLSVSRDARYLFVESVIYGNKHLTDGFVPENALRRLSDTPDLDGGRAELVAAGFWKEVPGGIQADWTHQESADAVTARRARSAASSRLNRERKERHASGDHSMCKHVNGHVTEGVTGHVPAHVLTVVTGPHPDPNQPDPSVGRGRVEQSSTDRHPFIDDSSGRSCETCGRPPNSPLHVPPATTCTA